MNGPASHEQIRRWFASPRAARKYALALLGTATDRRERRCLAEALAPVPPGARVLDLACGTGRLLPVLAGLGYRVFAADSSAPMIARAREYARSEGLAMEPDDFRLADALETGYPDDAFDAVVCNRLFHHFTDPAVRQRALRELRRICTGRSVVSFFRILALDAITHSLKHWLRQRPMTDRIPIRLKTFEKDIAAAGLVLKAAIGTRPLISKQWYVVLERGPGP